MLQLQSRVIPAEQLSARSPGLLIGTLDVHFAATKASYKVLRSGYFTKWSMRFISSKVPTSANTKIS